jgi:DNA-binding transcriptional ArsR family regulator
MITWREAVIRGIRRLVNRKSSVLFTRQEILSEEIGHIAEEAGSDGQTPGQTLSRILQELRDDGLVTFIDNQGNYIYLGDPIKVEEETLTDSEIDAAIRARKLTFGAIPTGETAAVSRYRQGQTRLRQLTLINYRHQCALCDVHEEQLLITAHLARWSDYPQGRGDLGNILCLCRWHDPLLEYGLISLTDDLKLLKKPVESDFLYTILKHTSEFRPPENISLAPEYLSLHRKRTGFSTANNNFQKEIT